MDRHDTDSLDDSLTIHQMFRKADSTDRQNHRHGFKKTAMSNTGNWTRISRKKSLKELGEAYLRTGKARKLANKLLSLDAQNRVKFFRQKQLKIDRKYRRKLLKSLRKQAKKNKKLLSKKKKNKKLSASSLIFQINDGEEK